MATVPSCTSMLSIHRMCSGQVVVDLATAVKELVENAVDAGATTVEVRLKEYGWKSIEVVDNGKGVSPSEYDVLVKKYHTSKLVSFEHLDTVKSFGFRGEALSSLCEISSAFTVKTKTKSQATGTKIEYAPDGTVRFKSASACSLGTTVIVDGLFAALPVRRNEFKRTLKRQYAKMLSIIQAYALILTGVRVSCANMVGKGKKVKRSNVFSTRCR